MASATPATIFSLDTGGKLAVPAIAAVEAADAEFFDPVPHHQTPAILTRLAG
jgi:hypothetical protein